MTAVAGVAADRDDGLSDGSSRWEVLRNLPAHKLEKKKKKKSFVFYHLKDVM